MYNYGLIIFGGYCILFKYHLCVITIYLFILNNCIYLRCWKATPYDDYDDIMATYPSLHVEYKVSFDPHRNVMAQEAIQDIYEQEEGHLRKGKHNRVGPKWLRGFYEYLNSETS